jgi:hypothetical protein
MMSNTLDSAPQGELWRWSMTGRWVAWWCSVRRGGLSTTLGWTVCDLAAQATPSLRADRTVLSGARLSFSHRRT